MPGFLAGKQSWAAFFLAVPLPSLWLLTKLPPQMFPFPTGVIHFICSSFGPLHFVLHFSKVRGHWFLVILNCQLWSLVA